MESRTRRSCRRLSHREDHRPAWVAPPLYHEDFDGAVLKAAKSWEVKIPETVVERNIFCCRSGRLIRKRPLETLSDRKVPRKASLSRETWLDDHLGSQQVRRALRGLGKDDRVRLWDTAQQKCCAGFTTPRLRNLKSFLLERPHMEVFIGQQSDKSRAVAKVGGGKSRKSSGVSAMATAKGTSRASTSSLPPPSSSATPRQSVRQVGKINMKGVLTSPYSILTRVDLREVVSLEALVHIFDANERAALFELLPEVDRNPKALLSLFRSNMHFVSSLSLYQDLQRSGGFDADYQTRLRAKRRRSKNWCDFKEAQYERFWGQKLDPKPVTEEQVAAWKGLDDQLTDAALAVLGPCPSGVRRASSSKASSASGKGSSSAPGGGGCGCV